MLVTNLEQFSICCSLVAHDIISLILKRWRSLLALWFLEFVMLIALNLSFFELGVRLLVFIVIVITVIMQFMI